MRGIAQLGRGMNIETVAECVETGAVRDRLTELGIDCAQGFLFGRPTPDRWRAQHEESRPPSPQPRPPPRVTGERLRGRPELTLEPTLQRRVVRLAGADADDAVDVGDEDLAVADLAGLRRT